LTVEVSVRVDTDDVERAMRRRDLLAKAGYPAIPVVIGTSVHEEAEKMADAYGVSLFEVKSE
jgi:predicted RecB family endonuclease